MSHYQNLVEDYNTPLYVTDLDTVERRYNRLRDTFEKFNIKYACKSNFDPLVLERLRGTQLVAGSSHEAMLAYKTGTAARNIQVTAVSPSKESVDQLVELSEESDQFTVTINEYDTAERLVQNGFSGQALIRLKANKDLMSSEKYTNGSYLKFGMTPTEVERSLETLRDSNAEFIGFHSHLGGSVMNEDIEMFCEHAEYVISRSQEYADIDNIQTINFGGGFGIPKKKNGEELDIEMLNRKLSNVLVDESSTEYVIEPGRYISGPSTVLLTEVRSIRDSEDGYFVGVDAGMSQFPRTTMFDVYHEITNISSSDDMAPQTVAGPTCSGADVFCSSRRFERASKNDLLAIENVGAYGFVMAGNFHAYPYPTVVSIEGEESPISGGFKLEDI